MLDLPHILLQRHDDEGPMRLLGALIIIAVSIIGTLVQWLQKRKEQKRLEEQRRRAQQQAAPQPPQRPGAARPSPRQAPPPRRPAPAQRPVSLQRKPHAPPRLPPLPKQPARAEPPATAPQPASSQDLSATEIGAAPARKEATGKQREFLRAVLNPRSLKQAYVLTEILQPPLALRDSTAPER